MATEPTASHRGVAGDLGQDQPDQREDQTDLGADVLEQHDRQLGRLRGADERDQLVPCGAMRLGLLDRGAQREATPGRRR